MHKVGQISLVSRRAESVWAAVCPISVGRAASLVACRYGSVRGCCTQREPCFAIALVLVTKGILWGSANHLIRITTAAAFFVYGRCGRKSVYLQTSTEKKLKNKHALYMLWHWGRWQTSKWMFFYIILPSFVLHFIYISPCNQLHFIIVS